MRKETKQEYKKLMAQVQEALNKSNLESRKHILFICQECGKSMIKIDKYTYKPGCKHIPKTWRLSVG
jgi:rubrerythrin